MGDPPEDSMALPVESSVSPPPRGTSQYGPFRVGRSLDEKGALGICPDGLLWGLIDILLRGVV